MSKRDDIRGRYVGGEDGCLLITTEERDDLLAVVDAAEKVLPILGDHTLMLRTLPYEHKARVHLREVDSALTSALSRVTEGGQT